MSLFPLNPLNKPDRTESIIPSYQAYHTRFDIHVEERNNVNFKEQYFNIWQQVWGLHKKYYDIREQDEEQWKQLTDESEAIFQKYEHTPEGKFVESLLLAVIGELSRESKKQATEIAPKAPSGSVAAVEHESYCRKQESERR